MCLRRVPVCCTASHRQSLHQHVLTLLICHVQDALSARAQPRGQSERILVFAETVAAANGVANALEEVGIHALLYHKSVSAADRAAALKIVSK